MAQESFVLNWAKQLATSPEGHGQRPQAELDQQLQQSLLLDQVIGRIRHSLDLPAILETTVAQVREFLLADRLVLYQFEQPDLVEQSLVSKDSAEKTAAASAPETPALSNAQSNTESNWFDGGTIGRCVHSGYVAYESRASANISSVLHFSEEHCFHPSPALRAQYLVGQPVAIDDVQQRYAGSPCLLEFLQQAQIKSKMIAPIIVQDRLWGLLIAHQCQQHRHWEETEATFLQHVAEHLAVAVSQASLYQQLRQQTVSLESCVIERTQNLHDALTAAESASVTKGEFLSTMSHELRTPLTYIIGMSATLLRWSFGDLSDRQRSYLNTINQSGEQLLDIINNILEFANIESGRSLLDFGELSLSELTDTLANQYQESSEKRGITFSVESKLTPETAPETDLFRADASRLQQIISNLLHNAIKFTPSGGQVTLRVWRERQTAVFQVEDTGIGIPESQRDVLFETFKQLESPFQREYSGTGLGLAMTKRLVELHSGSIQVDSQVGQGSTFTVRLPVQAETVVPPRYPVLALAADATERIVLLETDHDNAATICEMLTGAGYEVIWLVEANQLAAQIEVLRPVMLIANLSLLGADPDEIKAVQMSVTALNAKVLALMNKKASTLSPMAHHDILRKPINPKTLLKKVRQLMVIAP